MTISLLSRFSQRPSLSVASDADQSNVVGGSDKDRSVWLREMERAQMAGWLDNGLTNGPRQALDLSNSSTAAGTFEEHAFVLPARDEFRATFFAEMQQLPDTVEAPVSATFSAAIVSSQKVSTASVAQIGLQQRLEQKFAQRISTFFSDKDSLPAAKPLFDGVGELSLAVAENVQLPRITLEWLGNDVRLWLGVSTRDGVSPRDLEQIVRDAKAMLENEGIRLQAVMYNGNPLNIGEASVILEKHILTQSADTRSMSSMSAGGVPFYSYFEIPQET